MEEPVLEESNSNDLFPISGFKRRMVEEVKEVKEEKGEETKIYGPKTLDFRHLSGV